VLLADVARAQEPARPDAVVGEAPSHEIVAAPIDDAPIIIIDDESNSGTASVPPSPGEGGGADFRARTWLRFDLESRFALDTSFDDTGEDVFEWWNVGHLELDHRASATLRAVAEARLRYGVVGEEPPGGERLHLLNAGEPKWTGQAELRQVYVEWTGADLSVRLGERIFVWGKNELLPPADVLNPVDLRYDPITAVRSPKEAKAPVLAADASYASGDSVLQLVLVPFFVPHRGFVFGRDYALAPPGSEAAEQLSGVGAVHPSVEDELQAGLVGTELPDESPENATIALRGTTRAGGWDLAATAVWGWDRTPVVRVDPDALLLLQNGERILANPQILVSDTELRDASIAVQQKVASGQELLSGRYRRMATLAVEAEGVVGEVVLRGDLGFSPEQVFYTSGLGPRIRPASRAVLGVEYTHGERWFVQVSALANVVFRPPPAALLGIDARDSEPGARDLAVRYGAGGTARLSLDEVDLRLSASGLYLLDPADWAVVPELAWIFTEPHELRLGALLLGGDRGGALRDHRDADFVYVAYRGTFG
jgi:hypothetical protein